MAGVYYVGIFRCLGGLWNIPCGRITKPGVNGDDGLNAAVFYLPQKPYNVLGTLVDQLTYPERGVQRAVSTAELAQILDQVDLSYLLERERVLIDETNWEEAISLGEKQRLAIARLLFQVKFNAVSFAILDECTSACSVEMERRLFGICNELKISYITISHRPALIAYHDKMVTIGDGKAGFTIKTLRRNVLASSTTPSSRQDESSEQSIKRHQDERSQAYLTGSDTAVAAAATAAQAQAARGTVARTWRLLQLSAAPGWKRQLGLICGGVLLRTVMNVGQLHYMGKMIENVIPQNVANLGKFTVMCLGVSVGLSGSIEIMRYYQRQLMMEMRDSLTSSLLSRFYRNRNFYTMVNGVPGGGGGQRIADPEQRLADDVETFTEVMSETLTEILSPLVDVTYFSFSLVRYTGLTGLLGLWTYLFGSLAIYRIILPDYKYFIQEEKSLQGKFKFVHGRVRAHAESVAFFGGGECERKIIDARFDQLMDLLRRKRTKDTQFLFAEGLLREKLPDALEWATQYIFLLRNPTLGEGEDGGKANYDMWNVGQVRASFS